MTLHLCAFCGANPREKKDRIFISGDEIKLGNFAVLKVCICNSCVKECTECLEEQKKKNEAIATTSTPG